jgi:hypothetical protein
MSGAVVQLLYLVVPFGYYFIVPYHYSPYWHLASIIGHLRLLKRYLHKIVIVENHAVVVCKYVKVGNTVHAPSVGVLIEVEMPKLLF